MPQNLNLGVNIKKLTGSGIRPGISDFLITSKTNSINEPHAAHFISRRGDSLSICFL